MKYRVKQKKKVGHYIAETKTANRVFDGYGSITKTYHKTREEAKEAVKVRKKDYYNDPFVDVFFDRVYVPVRYFKRKR